MNYSQILLVLGAIVILSLISLNVYRSILNSSELTIDSESIITANAVANDILTEITSKSFDEATVSTILEEDNIPTAFTTTAGFGPDDESYPAYDDIDDFDGYSTVISTPRLGNFDVNVSVDYVHMNNPDVVLASKTRTKRIIVTVTNSVLVDTLKLYYYASL